MAARASTQTARPADRGNRRQQSRPSAAQRPETRLQTLHNLLGELLDLHRALLQVVEAKLEAMRCSDAMGIQRCVDQESRLIQQIHKAEGMRRCVAKQVAKDSGVPFEPGVDVALKQLAPNIDSAWRQPLQDIGSELGDVLGTLRHINRRAATLARQVQDWHRTLVKEATTGLHDRVVYGRHGHDLQAPTAQVIDTTY